MAVRAGKMVTADERPEHHLRPACPICDATAEWRFRLGPYSVFDCPACDHRFSPDALREDHLGSVYSDDYFFGGGAGYDDYLLEADLLRAQGRRYGALLARHAPPGRVLDVGAAAGFLQAGLGDAGWTTTGLEPNATMVAHARNVLGLDTLQGSLEDQPDCPPFDAVCLIQVIGHFYDLRRALAAVGRLTRPGGLCLIEYWRRESAAARVMGRGWHEYSPPSVIHWFTRASLDAAMRRHGFSPIDRGAPKKYISGGHARSLLEHKLRQLPLGRMLAAPTALIPSRVNFLYPAFDVEWRLYRREAAAPPAAGPDTTRGDSR